MKRRNNMGRLDEAECSFILLRPKVCGEVGKIAKTIATYEGVKNVFVTSGDYGFVVHASYTDDAELKRLEEKIAKVANSEASSIIGHLSYKA